MSHKGYISKPQLPEVRKANRLRGAADKKRKDEVKAKAARKRQRKDNHDKACARVRREGIPPPSMPESTEEEDSSTGRVDFSESDDFEMVTAVSPPPAQQGAGVEASAMALGERRLALAMLVRTPAVRADQRSPTPAAGRMSPASAAGKDSFVSATGGGSPCQQRR